MHPIHKISEVFNPSRSPEEMLLLCEGSLKYLKRIGGTLSEQEQALLDEFSIARDRQSLKYDSSSHYQVCQDCRNEFVQAFFGGDVTHALRQVNRIIHKATKPNEQSN
jgi:hypothetical protein